MAQAYFSLVTNVGKIKLAQSAAGGGPVVITHFGVGDGNGAETNPTAASTVLVREVWRTAIESVVTDPGNPSAVLVTAIIPTNVGGWWMREFGVFDAAGAMIAVAKPVSQYKPTALEGQLEDIRYEFQIIIGEAANVTLLVDPSILLASREWVETRKTPINRLAAMPWVPVKSMTVANPPANPTTGDLYVIAPAPGGVWTGHAGKLAEWLGATWATISPPDGHGIGLPDGRIYVREAGVYVELKASETHSGVVELATVAETLAGTDTSRAITPAALAAALPIKPDKMRYNTVYPTILTADNCAPLAGPAGQVSISAFSFNWRGSLTINIAAQNLPTVANKTYHLRAKVNPVDLTVTVGLFDLANPAYNPSAKPEYDVMFDGTYDDLLIARVITYAGNVPSIIALKNAASLIATVERLTYASSTTPGAGWVQTGQVGISFCRTPRANIENYSLDVGDMEMVNRVVMRVDRYGAAADVWGYWLVTLSNVVQTSPVYYVTGVWKMHLEA